MREMTRVMGRPMSTAGWKVSNLTYQSPVTPSQRPLMRLPVMQPSSYTRCAMPWSSASSAPRALLWICSGGGGG